MHLRGESDVVFLQRGVRALESQQLVGYLLGLVNLVDGAQLQGGLGGIDVGIVETVHVDISRHLVGNRIVVGDRVLLDARANAHHLAGIGGHGEARSAIGMATGQRGSIAQHQAVAISQHLLRAAPIVVDGQHTVGGRTAGGIIEPALVVRMLELGSRTARGAFESHALPFLYIQGQGIFIGGLQTGGIVYTQFVPLAVCGIGGRTLLVVDGTPLVQDVVSQAVLVPGDGVEVPQCGGFRRGGLDLRQAAAGGKGDNSACARGRKLPVGDFEIINGPNGL